MSAAMVISLLAHINESEDTLLIDKLVNAGIFSRESADEFMEAVY